MRTILLLGACLAFVVSCAPGAPGTTAEVVVPTSGAVRVEGTAAATGGTATVASPTTPPPAASRTPPAAARRLPPPRTTGTVSVEEALARRRSARDLLASPLDDVQLGQLLWAAQGVTDAAGHRTAPSAGALYPLELYAATADGVSRYLPETHALDPLTSVDRRPDLRFAAFAQEVVGAAPLVIVITGVVARTAARYGDRAERYVILEAGHAAQNVLLEATSLGLGAVPVGAFDDAMVARVLELPPDRLPLYLIPVGRPR